jgi:hypothetical protein
VARSKNKFGLGASVHGKTELVGPRMILIAGLAIVVVVAVVDVFTLASIRRQPQPRAWRAATALLLSAGVAVGVWCAFFWRYAWSEELEVLGFPIPLLVFQWEGGRWVDYVGNPILGFVSLFLVASAFLLPVSLGLVLAGVRRRWRRSRA